MLKHSLPFYLAVSVTCSSGIRPCSLGGRGFESHRGQKNDLCSILQLPLLGLKHSLGFVGCFLYHLNFHSLTAPYHSVHSIVHLIFMVIMIQDLRTSLVRNRTLKMMLNYIAVLYFQLVHPTVIRVASRGQLLEIARKTRCGCYWTAVSAVNIIRHRKVNNL